MVRIKVDLNMVEYRAARKKLGDGIIEKYLRELLRKDLGIRVRVRNEFEKEQYNKNRLETLRKRGYIKS